ncbi:MAG: aldo/keto reductase, partial [Candidatus Hydrogenedentes bacterium]|nr:aldo/keto reductase [Candidatus Hydrogenedentota bacterium]
SFLKASTLGVALAATSGGGAEDAAPPGAPAATGPVPTRVLGRTKLVVGEVSVGAMRTTEPAVLQAAFDRGVNYVDTAHCYMGGKNERIVGEAIKGRRDQLIVATKCHMVTPKGAIIKSLEESLASLGTDHVDLLQLHMPKLPDVLHPDAKEALAELKQAGKVRFAGVTTHSDQIGVLDAVHTDPDKFYDTVLVAYNFESPQELTDAITRAGEAGLGIIAMKTQAGGYKTEVMGDASPHQAALKWALRHPHVHTCIPAMVSIEHVTENVGAMGLKLTKADEQVLERYAAAIRPMYCHRCDACTGMCPNGVDVQTINRALMYAEGYNDYGLASETYAGIALAASAAQCTDCDVCVVRCKHALNIGEKMRKARMLFV